MVDGLELEGAGDALRVALLDVEGGGEPEVGLDVGAPAIEVVPLAVVGFGAGEVAVEADYVAVAGLDPDAAKKRPVARLPPTGVTSKTAVGVLPRKSLRTKPKA